MEAWAEADDDFEAVAEGLSDGAFDWDIYDHKHRPTTPFEIQKLPKRLIQPARSALRLRIEADQAAKAAAMALRERGFSAAQIEHRLGRGEAEINNPHSAAAGPPGFGGPMLREEHAYWEALAEWFRLYDESERAEADDKLAERVARAQDRQADLQAAAMHALRKAGLDVRSIADVLETEEETVCQELFENPGPDEGPRRPTNGDGSAA